MRLNPFDTDNIDVRGGGGSRFPGGGEAVCFDKPFPRGDPGLWNGKCPGLSLS